MNASLFTSNRHCSLCFLTGHNSSNCINYPIQELHMNLLNIFKECIRYNVTHFGLNNYQEKRNHIIEINNLSLSEIKLLARSFGLRINYNRFILIQRVFDIYVGLVERELNNNQTFIQEMNERNNLLHIQQVDNNFRNNINIALTRLQTNMNLLSNEELRNYVSQIGTYIHFTSSGIPIELPELPSPLNNNEQPENEINNNINNNNNNENNINFNISLIKLDEPITSDNNENNDNDNHYCPICMDTTSSDSIIITNCNHTFCNECVCKYIQTCNNDSLPRCFICRENTYSYSSSSENTIKKLKNVILSLV